MNPALSSFPTWAGGNVPPPVQPGLATQVFPQTAAKIGSGDAYTLFNMGKRAGAMTPTRALGKAAGTVLSKAAIPLTVVSAIEPLAQATSDRARETGQAIPTAIASTQRPITSWNQPISTLGIDATPRTFNVPTSIAKNNTVMAAASSNNMAHTPTTDFSPSYPALDLFHDVDRPAVVAPPAPTTPVVTTPVMTQSQTPAIEMPIAPTRKHMTIQEALGESGGSNVGSAEEGLVRMALARGTLAQNNADVNNEQRQYETKVAALPHFAQAALAREAQPATISHLNAQTEGQKAMDEYHRAYADYLHKHGEDLADKSLVAEYNALTKGTNAPGVDLTQIIGEKAKLREALRTATTDAEKAAITQDIQTLNNLGSGNPAKGTVPKTGALTPRKG